MLNCNQNFSSLQTLDKQLDFIKWWFSHLIRNMKKKEKLKFKFGLTSSDWTLKSSG